ncbi:hypothetical protein MNBD_NITROSPINAE02-613 [hydrothermal vent metagenome]|uniref:RND transporter n=1 Tax=hydrothermal vent metagenome TaxID=652676 RepID=A0A3B1BZZ9_9ZZZZ
MLDLIPYRLIIPAAIILAVAPVFPQPHLVEKLAMLKNGSLNRPIDIFDLFLHGAPVALLAAKLFKDYLLKSA